ATRGNSRNILGINVLDHVVSIPMLRAGIHNMKVFDAAEIGVSIPMLRAGIHAATTTRTRRLQGFNSHATRGNSPVYRQEPRLVCVCFNSHATRGNSPDGIFYYADIG